MRDGQVENGRVWFSFNLQQAEWLLDWIPRGDAFRDVVNVAIEQLANEDSLEHDSGR